LSSNGSDPNHFEDQAILIFKKLIMAVVCPFSSIEYLKGLSNIGVVDQHPSLSLAVLRRRIYGTNNQDGVGPWPYRWISDESDIELFSEGFRHLVSLCVVAQPGWKPSSTLASNVNIQPLKDHFVFDPDKSVPPLSKRAIKRLSTAEHRGRFEMILSKDEQILIVWYYEQLKLRRMLIGGFFDMTSEHFASIARIPGAVFFRVKDSYDVGAMACGVVINNFLQILHIVPTLYGLSWNASYLMMYGLQDFVRQHGLILLTGGMPAEGSKGLSIFKHRWANTFLSVNMLCIVNDTSTADKLADEFGYHPDYFPHYRYKS
jgi:hypothetical protein